MLVSEKCSLKSRRYGLALSSVGFLLYSVKSTVFLVPLAFYSPNDDLYSTTTTKNNKQQQFISNSFFGRYMIRTWVPELNLYSFHDLRDHNSEL